MYLIHLITNNKTYFIVKHIYKHNNYCIEERFIKELSEDELFKYSKCELIEYKYEVDAEHLISELKVLNTIPSIHTGKLLNTKNLNIYKRKEKTPF